MSQPNTVQDLARLQVNYRRVGVFFLVRAVAASNLVFGNFVL